MSGNRELDQEIGDIEEYEKQFKIYRERGLEIIGPVYKSWKPHVNVTKGVERNPKLNNVSTMQILNETLNFVNHFNVVTVRQSYYGLVSNQTILNYINEYRRVIHIVKRGRLSGLVPFDKIVDDTRGAEKTHSWESINKIIGAAINQYRSDWWSDQEYYIEVWLEKRALRRIFYPITNEYDVHLCIGGGYQSLSEIWEAKKRFESREGKIKKILYFGDLDPSGKDMPRDIHNRFEILKTPVIVEEVALSREDIEDLNLPRNPTKQGDTRKQWFVKKYGIDYAVELDALPPNILINKIRQAILDHVANLGL